jgi:hypothetical protein
MTGLNWKVGDWAVFERDIVQITDIRESGGCSVSTGMFETSGNLVECLRPLTLRNKSAIEYFDHYYKASRRTRLQLSGHSASLRAARSSGNRRRQRRQSPVRRGCRFFPVGARPYTHDPGRAAISLTSC